MNKQQVLIQNLLSSPSVFAICQNIIDPDFFDPENRKVIKFVKDYYKKYNSLPDPVIIEGETGAVFKLQELTTDQVKYTIDEVERFCKLEAVKNAVLKSIKLIENEDLGQMQTLINEAVALSLQDNLGLSYFDDVTERLERMSVETPVISTGWKVVDEALFGGMSRKELLLVAANSGGGKSITLSNLALNTSVQGYNVLYISLELSEDVVAQRFDTMITGIGRKDWKKHKSEIINNVKKFLETHNTGRIDIVQLPSGTRAIDIRSYLKEYELAHHLTPDVIIVDYLDKMSPNEKNISASDVWSKDKACSEQLRDIGVDYNAAIATASQLNRSAVNASQHDHSHIAGGISKINESDIYWTILLSESMKAQGKCAFTFQKTRNSDGVGKTVYLKWVGKNLRIVDEDDPDELTFHKKGETPNETTNIDSLIDLMSID